MKFRFVLACLLVSGIPATTTAGVPNPPLPGSANLSSKALLGQQLFFDTNLSQPAGQACASCHNPAAAFTDADKTKPTSKGVNPALFGNRNSPTAMYAAYSPAFYYDRKTGLYMGGQFLDGRASTLAEQAKKPFLNPVEMANPNAAAVVTKVRNANYASQFNTVYGVGALNNSTAAEIDQAYARIADAIAEYERSPVFNRFTSKYDFYLFGKASFTVQEVRGRAVFELATKGNCAACHPSRSATAGSPPLFTDFSYDNIGVPKNPDSLFYSLLPAYNPAGAYFVDLGLGGSLNVPAEDGRFKVPTLRNIAVTAPYTHNGYFKTLRGVVEFYATRDTKKRCTNAWTNDTNALAQKCWPAPETLANVNHAELGALKLTTQDIDDLVAFLNTLTDGYQATSPWPYKAP